MYWTGVLLMVVVSAIYLYIGAKTDKIIYLNNVVFAILIPLLSWVGFVIFCFILIAFCILFLIEEGNKVIIWKSKNRK